MNPAVDETPAAPSPPWRRLVPGTLFGQVLVALVVGIVAAQLVGAWIVIGDRAAFAERIAGGHAAQRIASALGALNHSAPDERPRLLRALDVLPTRITLGEPWAQRGAPPEPETEDFEREVQSALESPIPVQVLAIQRFSLGRPRHERPPWANEPGGEAGEPPRPGGEPADRPAGPGEPGADRGDWRRRIVLRVILQARLDDGAIATFRQSLPGPHGEQPLRLLGWLAAVMVIVAALAGWIVRRLTRPLARFAAAATGLARDLDQPPLPERGAREIAAAAQAFNRMQRDLKQLLETRAQALAAVSHDLRLPLTRVRLRIEQIADAATRGAIENDLADMDRMIGNTLEFLRAGKSRESPVPLDLDALVDSVASDIETLGAVVNVRGSSGAPIAARPQALARCLANLLDNARRYGVSAAAAPGSVAGAGAGVGDAGAAIDVTLADLGRQVEIRIEDRGPGIAPADRQRVFEPYVRLEDSRAQHTGGTGLGLAIARAIARAHGGDVTLAARDGGGLVAIVLLPRTLDRGVGAGRQPPGAVAAH